MTARGALIAGLVALTVVSLGFPAWRYYEHKVRLVLLGQYDKKATCDGDFWVFRAESRAPKHGSVAVVSSSGQGAAFVPVSSVRLQACLAVVNADFVDREARLFEQQLAGLRQLATRRIADSVDAYLNNRFDAGKAVILGWLDVYNVGQGFLAACVQGLQRVGVGRCLGDGIEVAYRDWGGTSRAAEAQRIAQIAVSVAAVAEELERRAGDVLSTLSTEASRKHQWVLVSRILRRNITEARVAGAVEEMPSVSTCVPTVEVPRDLPGFGPTSSVMISFGLGFGLDAATRHLLKSSLAGFLASAIFSDAIVVKMEEALYRTEIKKIVERHFVEKVTAWEGCSAKVYRDHLTQVRGRIATRIGKSIEEGTLTATWDRPGRR